MEQKGPLPAWEADLECFNRPRWPPHSRKFFADSYARTLAPPYYAKLSEQEREVVAAKIEEEAYIAADAASAVMSPSETRNLYVRHAYEQLDKWRQPCSCNTLSDSEFELNPHVELASSQGSGMSSHEHFQFPKSIQVLLSDKDKLGLVLMHNPKLLQMLQETVDQQ